MTLFREGGHLARALGRSALHRGRRNHSDCCLGTNRSDPCRALSLSLSSLWLQESEVDRIARVGFEAARKRKGRCVHE